MLKIRTFECSKCAGVFEDLTEGLETECSCGGNAHRIWTPPRIAVHGAEVFNPHYDEQVGQWFESADHKKNVLKKLGKTQVSGPMSPRKEKKTSIPMSLDQAVKFDPSLSTRIAAK